MHPVLQTQQHGEARFASDSAIVARDARGDTKAEGSGQAEALQLHPELGSANDSVQAVRVSWGRERKERTDEKTSGRKKEGLTLTAWMDGWLADSLVTISRNKQRKKKKKGLDCEYVSLPFRRRGLMKKSSCEA